MIFDTGPKIHMAASFHGRTYLYNPDLEITERQRENWLAYPYKLESYHYIGDKPKVCDLIRECDTKVFLDSGAFSMFTKGVHVPLEDYARFIKDNGDIIEVASVLDAIGDPQATLSNQHALEDLGVEVLPCFHYGEPLKYLEKYMDEYDHFTLGGMVPISTPDLIKWLDDIWGNYLTDDKGFPTHKIHGFGLTSLELMKRYPWYSVDSTSWVMTSMFGSIYWDLGDGRETKISLSDQSPATKAMGKHYDNMSVKERQVIREGIEAKGFDVDQLRTLYWMRDLWNVEYFRGLCDHEILPFIKRQGGLFDA